MQTCAILEPEKESTSKEERPMKKVLILSGSPRKDGNSDLLCSEFMRGAQESGNEVQKIFVRSKKIVPCNACYYCRDHGGKCALNDDMSEILDAMQAADVIVMASPVYFYSIDGRLIFPVERSYYSGDTLEQLHLTYYNNIDPDETVDICNTLRQRAADGQTIFYDIYTEDEKAADPDKADTGLFYFKGNPGAKFAICNAGGAFAYVGAMQDSFPHALELSRKEYNAFALIYRPGAQTACEDLARAIAFVFTHAEELEVDTSSYSLWGGSAGARMAAWLGSYGTASFGEQAYPQPGAVIMQYTGLGEVYGNEPPTYACVGDRDYIADERVMRWRIETIRSHGTPAEIEVFPGLAHGFGLGTGTSAEGWLDHAVAFWEENT